jgi:hypothetical protein
MKMQEDELGYCGIDCAVCPVFIATANDDLELRQKTALEWNGIYKDAMQALGMQELKPRDMNCRGCRKEDRFLGCMSCPIRKCNRDKDLTTCASCRNFEACDMLQGFYSNVLHRQAKDNLESIRLRAKK